MAAKKQLSSSKPDPLVIGPFDLRDLHDSGLCEALSDKQNGVRIAAHMALLGHEDIKIRNLVGRLFENQHALLQKLVVLLKQFEDPSVAHAIAMKEQLDDLKREVRELRDDLNSHERNNEHESRRDY